MNPEPPNPLGEDARQVADAAAAEWRAVDTALSPVLGRRGVAALYKRTLYLAMADRPWLAAAYRSPLGPLGPLGPLDVDALHGALAQQPRSRAAEAAAAISATFRSLLSGLIGPALAAQLLPAAPSHSSGGTPAANGSS